VFIGLFANNINEKKEDLLEKKKFLDIAKEIIIAVDNPMNIKKIYEKYNLSDINLNLLETSNSIYKKPYSFGFIEIVKSDEGVVLHLKYLDEIFVLKEKNSHFLDEEGILNTLVLLNILVLIAIFVYIINLLSPLKKVAKEIKKFANGDFTTRVSVNSKDEIADLGNSFNTMAEKIEDLIKTREELLRDIGHELRTPISKGRFALERTQESEEKEFIKKVFTDLEVLTAELIELEKLRANSLNKEKFDVETLIAEALCRLYIDDEENISIDVKCNFSIHADLYYLSMALKNLIENAIKYTTGFPIKVEVSETKIIIINSGEKLDKDISYYLKPFTQKSNRSEVKGFGLGLSIVDKILKKHNFRLDYEYKDGYNLFSINL
jgi:two-component system OmpR family sensor kinase